METVAKFISTLFHCRNQAHIFHLQTQSYAAHKALNEFYDGIILLIDSYVEAYQGRYGIITGYAPVGKFLEGDSEILKYFMAVQQFVDVTRKSLPQDGELSNIIDEISALVSSTNYKIRFLK